MILQIREYSDDLAGIDYESGHEGDRERNVTLEDMKKNLKERFRQGHETFFAYGEDGILKGYASLKPFFPGHKHCELYWIAVRKKYQGKGIGTELLGYLENYARKQGFRKVCAYTGRSMIRTREFYEKRGYYPVNEFPDYYGFEKNNTAVLYAKKI